MSKPEPERDQDGFLPDETIFKVYASSAPLTLRWVLVAVAVSIAAALMMSGFEVVAFPKWLDLAMMFGMLALVIFCARLSMEDMEARDASTDHRPGTYDRAMENYLARHRFLRWLHEGTDFFWRWSSFGSWRGWVTMSTMIVVFLSIGLLTVTFTG